MPTESDTKRIPYLRVWVDDIKGSCIDFSAAQFGAHMRMLLVAWERGHVPTDERVLKRIVGEIDWTDMPMVLARWRRTELDGVGEVYINARLERERERMIQDAERKRASGKRGAERRWNSRHMTEPCRNDGGKDDGEHGETMPFPNSHIPILLDSQSPENPNAVVGPKARRRATATITWDFESGFAGIPESDLTEWADAYGKIDVPEQVKQAHQHLRVHTEKRYKNYRRYLGDWMARAQRYAEERIAKAEAAEAARARGPVRDESHIPEDVHPDDKRLFFTPDGKPRTPPIWRRKDGSCSIE